MTISELCRGRSTLDQLYILHRADVVLSGRLGGRYYAGQISEAVQRELEPRKSEEGAPR